MGRKLLCDADVDLSVGNQKMVVADAAMGWVSVQCSVEGQLVDLVLPLLYSFSCPIDGAAYSSAGCGQVLGGILTQSPLQ